MDCKKWMISLLFKKRNDFFIKNLMKNDENLMVLMKRLFLFSLSKNALLNEVDFD